MNSSQRPHKGTTVSGDAARIAAGFAAVGMLTAKATADTDNDQIPTVLVQLYLRGGADGLTLCVPEDEAEYHNRRSTTRVHASHDTSVPASMRGTLIEPKQLSPAYRTGFSIPPALVPLKPVYDSGELAFVHGVGCLDETRSHFAQQSNTETGETDMTPSRNGDGWIGRYLNGVGPRGNGSLRALAFANQNITSYSGGGGVTPTLEPQFFELAGGTSVSAHLQAIYGVRLSAVQTALTNDTGAVTKLMGVNWAAPTTLFPSSVLGTQFERAYHAIRDIPDLEVVSIDYDNITGQRWDTHANQGVFTGTMKNLMDDLSSSLYAFQKHVLGISGRRVVVLVYTEFGRTLNENDGQGTDHGRGGVAMVMGDGVQGGQVFTHPTAWQGLAPAHLDPPFSGDQAVTIDIRDLQAEIMMKRMGVGNANVVFPDANYTYTDHGLIV